jgi:hypothetical protein
MRPGGRIALFLLRIAHLSQAIRSRGSLYYRLGRFALSLYYRLLRGSTPNRCHAGPVQTFRKYLAGQS